MSNRNDEREVSEAIKTLAKQIAKALQYADSTFDRTFISVVQSVNEDGTYGVIDEYNTTRNCVLAIPNVTLEVGERVYVTLPQNDISKMYISGVYPLTNKKKGGS